MNHAQVPYDLARFGNLYQQAVSDVISFWTPEMQGETARHNSAWGVGQTDFREYLYASKTRYEACYRSIFARPSVQSICDVGGFFGAFPLALSRMGYRVAMTEALQYYSASFDALFKYLTEQGVSIVDYDPFGEDAWPADRTFDALTIMAVLEHYPHSPKNFMSNVRAMAHEDSLFFIEVPNIAYMPKRLRMLSGKSPLAPIQNIYNSAVPFTGHHHEYTMEELVKLIEMADLELVDLDYFNYSFRGPLYKRVISDPLLTLSSFFPNLREEIAVTARIGATKGAPHK